MVSKERPDIVKPAVFCLIIVFVLFSCATPKESDTATLSGTVDFTTTAYASFFNTPPQGGRPVFFAAAPRMSDRDSEVDECLISAACQASKYIAAKATSFFLVKENNRDLFYLEDLDIQYDISLAEELVRDLTIVKKLQDRNGTYILAELQDNDMPSVPYNPRTSGGTPAWVRDYPVISGYYVGVGVATRSGRFDTSLAAADDRALEEILRQISVNQVSDRLDLEIESVGTAFSQERQEISEAVVTGFYVLARWVSPDGSNYYSLGICPRAENTTRQ